MQKVVSQISASLNNTFNSYHYQTLFIPGNFQMNNKDKDGGLFELAYKFSRYVRLASSGGITPAISSYKTLLRAKTGTQRHESSLSSTHTFGKNDDLTYILLEKMMI